MAKRKKSKNESSKGFQYSKEFAAVILIILSLVGLGSFGLIGKIVMKFSVFLFGSWYFIILLLCMVIGLIIVASRKKPNYFSARLVGIYTIIIAILLFSHLNYITSNEVTGKEIMTTTYENISASYEDASKVENTGGGMVGSVISYVFVSLFDVEGTKIVMIVIAVFGFIMVLDITLTDVLKLIFSPFKQLFNREPNSKLHRYINEEDEEDDDDKKVKEEKEDKRIKITSVEDLEPHGTEVVGTLTPKELELPENKTEAHYVKPPVTLLDLNKNKGKVNSTEFISSTKSTLERTFQDYGIRGRVIEVHVGPAVTQYEMEIERGTKVNRVLSISKEIALSLAAKEVRIEAPIPGKNTVGVEIPNQSIVAVTMREIMESIPKKYDDTKLMAPLGRDIMGNVKYVDINKTPHMLVAGATGSGKSVCINNIIVSLLMRTTPEEVKMVLVDPKKVEFNVYENIPHLLMPVVTDPKKASVALQKIVVEMDNRYETFKNSETKSLSTYNDYVAKKLEKNPECGLKPMPYIVVIIDELADLMLVAAKEVEESIMRITQLARAAGIHMIVATQRPSANIITGVIKANIPTRVSFAVSSSIDSRTILDMTGAEKLLGKGDMLYKPMDDNTPTRIQGSFVSDEEIKRVVDFVKKRSTAPEFDDKFVNLEKTTESSSSFQGDETKEKDVLYDEILNYAIRTGQISASLIQRKYSIGYNRAARIMDIFEEKGIVGPAKGSKPRDVLVKLEEDN